MPQRSIPAIRFETTRMTTYKTALITGASSGIGAAFAATLARVGTPAALAAEAKPGSGRIGRGIVCDTCRTPPRVVGLK